MINSNRKGKVAEQDVAKVFRAMGFSVERRGLGVTGLPDLVLSYNGEPARIVVSVKNSRAVRADDLIRMSGPLYRWWIELLDEAGTRPKILVVKFPPRLGWWIIMTERHISLLRDYAGYAKSECSTIVIKKAWYAMPLAEFQMWATAYAMIQAWK